MKQSLPLYKPEEVAVILMDRITKEKGNIEGGFSCVQFVRKKKEKEKERRGFVRSGEVDKEKGERMKKRQKNDEAEVDEHE